MADLPQFHILEESHAVAVHPDLVQQLEQDGLDVEETLRGILTVDAQVFEGDGPINEYYCWMHSPGGWSCPECRGDQ